MRKTTYFLKLMEILDELHYENSCGIPIIVEGKRDIQSLRKLGIEGTIISISKTPIFKLVDELREENIKEIILLTDFDRAGRQYAKDIIVELESKKIKVNRSFRRGILKYSKGALKDIEGLYNYIIRRQGNMGYYTYW
ncbi:toprim domain-containing protein [Methanothermococcus sp. SCGC AD-155-M21]|nr:toprim domain-containing protein [Methanothermococcus sp. SCGC AD-155-M21]